MKRYLAVWIMVFLSLSLTSCVTTTNSYLTKNDMQEFWRHAIDSNPERWKCGADHWFFTADPNETEMLNKKAPAESAISTMSVAVPQFTNIRIDGGFETQIFGVSGNHNTVDVLGPNAGVNSISVDVLDDEVYIHAHKDASPEVTKVIVRIGVAQLRKLTQSGCGSIQAIRIKSRGLIIESTPGATGDVYLSGNVRLLGVRQAGTSTINIFGVCGGDFPLDTNGSGGGVNIAGNVRVRSIIHHGHNDINIIGANSPSLSICGYGAGKIGIKGFVRLNTVLAHDKIQIYVAQSSSRQVDVSAFDCSIVGIAGDVGSLSVNTRDGAHFLGKSFCAQNVYAEARGSSHINITASNRAFASAYTHSVIYFFGPEHLLAGFHSRQAVVLALGGNNFCNRNSEFRSYEYSGVHEQCPRFVGAG